MSVLNAEELANYSFFIVHQALKLKKIYGAFVKCLWQMDASVLYLLMRWKQNKKVKKQKKSKSKKSNTVCEENQKGGGEN